MEQVMADQEATAVASRWLLVVAGLTGALGVATAAGASHGDARLLGAVSTICLGHGPALLALGLYGLRTRALAIAAVLLAGGTVLFTVDLLWRQFQGGALLPMLAPLSGGALILGWLLLGLSALAWRPAGRR